MDLKQLQIAVAAWSSGNFGEQSSDKPFKGLVEELGELAHADLKMEQEIRSGEDHVAKGQDAVGDIVIYLADYCFRKGWDLNACVEATWREVSQRDWKKYPRKGVPG